MNTNFLTPVRCFLLDMDGTFYLGENILPGSLDFIKAVEKTGRDFYFLTNNSSHNADFYVQRLGRMGLPTGASKIITSGEATVDYVVRKFSGAKAFILGNESLKQEFANAGIVHTVDHPDCVVVGFDTTLDYKKMCAVCELVTKGLPFIATHPDINCPTETGFVPDVGAILAFIETSTGRKPELIIGKPYNSIVEYALQRTGQRKEGLAMVGDRLYTDIKTGLDFGILSILVMSGETTPEMLESSGIAPDMTFPRLDSMVPLL